MSYATQWGGGGIHGYKRILHHYQQYERGKGKGLKCPEKNGYTILERPLSHMNCESFQGSTLAVFRYPEHPKFSDGIPDLHNQTGSQH